MKIQPGILSYKTTYRVIYADTDNMGVAYYANYLRWFEIGRTELIRSWGLSYKKMEQDGVFLPVSEVHCKFISPARYDDILVIQASLDISVRAAMKFDYLILDEPNDRLLARGHTRHAFMGKDGKILRPPAYLQKLIREMLGAADQSKLFSP